MTTLSIKIVPCVVSILFSQKMYIWNISSIIITAKSTDIYGKNWLQAGIIDRDSSNHNRLHFRSDQEKESQKTQESS